MILLLIAASLVAQAPSDALCASAYALEAARMQQSGELPSPFADPQLLTAPQRTGVAASRRLIAQGVAWTALATRTPEGRKEANASYRALARSQPDANAAFAACSAIRVEDRMPAIPDPPAPRDGQEECAAAVADLFAALRACAGLEALRGQAQAVQSKLEQGAMTCRSKDQARATWSQMGATAAGADSVGQRARCAAQ